MQQKRICLTKEELLEICAKYKGHNCNFSSMNYALSVFDYLSKPEKVSIFTKFSNFIDKKADSFFMVFLVATIFLLMKIAIEAYFLSIK